MGGVHKEACEQVGPQVLGKRRLISLYPTCPYRTKLLPRARDEIFFIMVDGSHDNNGGGRYKCLAIRDANVNGDTRNERA